MDQRLLKITKKLNERYPEGDEPFKIMTRMAEEVGELANEVGRQEGTGIKRQKYGQTTKGELAKEIADVMQVAAALAVHYGLEVELDEILEKRSKEETVISGPEW